MRRDIFEVRDEGNGWISIWRGQTSCGAPIRGAIAVVGFEGPPDETLWPRTIIRGTDCGRMPPDRS